MNNPPNPPATLADSRERLTLQRGINLRNHACAVLSNEAFEVRKNYLVSGFKSGGFLKDPSRRGQPAPNPMSDPAGMEAVMGMLKGNMLMMIPQTLIMSWINAFFSGFVICMLSSTFTARLEPYYIRSFQHFCSHGVDCNSETSLPFNYPF